MKPNLALNSIPYIDNSTEDIYEFSLLLFIYKYIEKASAWKALMHRTSSCVVLDPLNMC
jgi:hypothetical protein